MRAPVMAELMPGWPKSHDRAIPEGEVPRPSAAVATASTIEHPGGTGEGAISKETFAAMNLTERVAFARANPEEFKAFAATKL